MTDALLSLRQSIVFVAGGHWPLNAARKIDRAQLPKPSDDEDDEGGETEMAGTGIEASMDSQEQQVLTAMQQSLRRKLSPTMALSELGECICNPS